MSFPKLASVALGVPGLLRVAPLALAPTAQSQPRPDSSGFVTTADGVKLYFAIYGRSRDTVLVPGGVLLGSHLGVIARGPTSCSTTRAAVASPIGCPTPNA